MESPAQIIDLGTSVERYRLDRDWTIRQMASACGLSVATISSIENRKVVPHKRTIARLKRAFPDLEVGVLTSTYPGTYRRSGADRRKS